MDDAQEPAGPPCPECSRPMEPGFVTATQSIRWAIDDRQGAFFGGRAEVLRTGSWAGHPKCPAHRCRPCRVALFTY